MTGNNHKRIFLQPRDRKLLNEVAEMPFADREQIRMVAGFHSLTRVNTRLLALTKAGFLKRVFIGTTGGGPKALYSLSRKGSQFIGVPYRESRRAHDEILVSDLLVEHRLCLNSLQVVLRHHPIPITGASLLRWRTFKEPLSEKVRITPDAYVEINSTQGVHPMFLEVDLGTETMDRWKEKVEAYLRLALSGEFGRLFQQPRFKILVVTRTDRRGEFIRRTVSKATDKIFWFSTFEAINRDGFWSAIWHRPKGDQKQSLL